MTSNILASFHGVVPNPPTDGVGRLNRSVARDPYELRKYAFARKNDSILVGSGLNARLFIWDPTSTLTDDNWTVFKPTAIVGAGRWVEITKTAAEIQAVFNTLKKMDEGRVLFVGGVTSIPVAFNFTFPAIPVINVSIESAGAIQAVAINTPTIYGFNFRRSSAAGTVSGHWFAREF
jgi:hypothetical protein